MAMLHMIGPALRDAGRRVAVATVDHGLRAEAVDEAAMVARECGRLGLPHATLHWAGWDGRGNLAAAAREARYRLLADWARGRGLAFVALAHTQDDQAETFLMRLARGSGIDGLVAMQGHGSRFGMLWLRPFLHKSRAELRDWLTARGLEWVEDPSNADPASERVRIRQALGVLGDLGITTDSIGYSMVRLSFARDALDRIAREAAERIAVQIGGAVVLEVAGLRALPYETQLRLLSGALRWVSSATYGPRLSALQPILPAVARGKTTTLHGAILIGSRDRITIARELRPVAALETPTTALWDNRWRLDGPHAPGLTIRAIGAEGLRQCPDWRAAGLPQKAMLATPAIWRGTDLVAAPLAGNPNGWTARLAADFATFLKSD